MGRRKLSMEWIKNEKARKTTFQKRKMSLMRKAYELSTLCDVDICLLIYGPNFKDQQAHLDTWPTDPSEVRRIVGAYQHSKTEKRVMKFSDLFELFARRKKMVEVEIHKLRKDMVQAIYPKWDERLDFLSEDHLRSLMDGLDVKIDTMKRMIDSMEGGRCGVMGKDASGMMGLVHTESSQNVAFPFRMSSTDAFMTMDGFGCSNNQGNAHSMGPTFVDPTVGLLGNMMINDPSPSLYQYALPIAQAQAGPLSYVQFQDMPGIPSQMDGSDQLNQFDYINELLMKTPHF